MTASTSLKIYRDGSFFPRRFTSVLRLLRPEPLSIHSMWTILVLGKVWLTIDLSDAWSGVLWGAFIVPFGWSPARLGAHTPLSLPDLKLNSMCPSESYMLDFLIPQLSYLSSFDSAKLFTFTDRIQGGLGEVSWGATNLQFNSSFFGATAVEAVIGIRGITLRQSENVPDTGGLLFLLAGACSGLIAFVIKRFAVRA